MTIRNILAVLATAGLALPTPLLAQEQGPKPAVKAAHAMASTASR